MKKVFKIISIFFLIICLILPLTSFNVTYAGIIDNIRRWRQDGEADQKKLNSDYSGMSQIAGFAWGIGLFVILVSGIVIGIKFMFCNSEYKAALKQSLVPYIIGTIAIFGALTIWKIIIDVSENFIT